MAVATTLRYKAANILPVIIHEKKLYIETIKEEVITST